MVPRPNIVLIRGRIFCICPLSFLYSSAKFYENQASNFFFMPADWTKDSLCCRGKRKYNYLTQILFCFFLSSIWPKLVSVPKRLQFVFSSPAVYLEEPIFFSAVRTFPPITGSVVSLLCCAVLGHIYVGAIWIRQRSIMLLEGGQRPPRGGGLGWGGVSYETVWWHGNYSKAHVSLYHLQWIIMYDCKRLDYTTQWPRMIHHSCLLWEECRMCVSVRLWIWLPRPFFLM